jgi:deoxyhypusine synthase
MTLLDPHRRMAHPPLEGGVEVTRLIDTYFNAYNAARLREACQVFVKLIEEDATVGVTLAGALTPAGLGSVLVPLIRAGFVDYIASTGANLYHDLHFTLGYPLYRSTAQVASGAADVELRKKGIIRIYDVLFDQKVLLDTDDWLYQTLLHEEFRGTMGTSTLHHRVGARALAEARARRIEPPVLATCHECDVPIYAPSPGDSTVGMNISAVWTARPEMAPVINPAIDVAETAGIVLEAKRGGRPSAVVIFGGGAPKNFLLQTEPQLQEVLGIDEKGHDYFVQVTDARPDTGGLSGATPSEAVSWGKIDPDQLPNTVVCYADSTIAMPLISAYVLAKARPRPLRRLYKRMPELVERLRAEHQGTRLYKERWGRPPAEGPKER